MPATSIMMKSIARCDMSWRICSRNGELAVDESRRTDLNGDARVAIWESRTKRVVTICRSLREIFRRATFIVARIAKKNFGASAAFVGRSPVLLAAENTTAAISIRGFG